MGTQETCATGHKYPFLSVHFVIVIHSYFVLLRYGSLESAAGNTGTTQATVTSRIFGQILLMIIFRVIKLRCLKNFSSNLAVSGSEKFLLIFLTGYSCLLSLYFIVYIYP